jgi:hypothetical protein
VFRIFSRIFTVVMVTIRLARPPFTSSAPGSQFIRHPALLHMCIT